MGYPLEIVETKKAWFLDALRTGHSRRAACGRAGITEPTAAAWMRADAEFREQCLLAEQESLAGLEAVILNEAHRDPAMALAVAGRKSPDDWAPRYVVRYDMADVAAILAALPAETFREVVAAAQLTEGESA